MRITKHGHSCLQVENAGTTVLLDPGSFSPPDVGDATGLSGVLVTHQHADHVDADLLARLAAGNPEAVLVLDPDTAEKVDGSGFAEVRVLRDGETTELGGLSVLGVGSRHATIHPDIPGIANTGYLLGGRLLHPGDALTVPAIDVELLAVPAAAPWSKLSETVEFVRAVRPRFAFPIHDALLTTVGRTPYDGGLERLKDPATEYRRIDDDGYDG